MGAELPIPLDDPPLPGLLADLVHSMPETMKGQGSNLIVYKSRDCVEQTICRSGISAGMFPEVHLTDFHG